MMRVVITGSNRGIGLALVRACLARGDTVFAACRRPEKARYLRALADEPGGDRLHLLPLDVTDAAQIAACVQAVSAQTDGLDLLINNAAINPPGQTWQEITAETFLDVLAVNTVAPLLVARSFVDLLAAGNQPKIANISSGAGSFSRGGSGHYGYRSSKAALNMVTHMMAADLQARGIAAVTINPGWVKTDMGGPGASLEPAESARGVLAVIDALTLETSGRFMNWDGSAHAW